MSELNQLEKQRKRVAWAMSGFFILCVAWLVFPGLPVLWAPRASASVKLEGQTLFEHAWAPNDPLAKGDGLGPVFNAQSCASCHFQGGVGGGGGNDHNVMAFEAHPTKDDPHVRGGLVHKFAVANQYFEDSAKLHRIYPLIKNGVRIESGCQILVRDFDRIRTESINSTALFGAGWIDRIDSKSISHQSWARALERVADELKGKFGGFVPGRYRVLPDGRIGKFGWKAQFATLEEFVAAACANEIGLGNPKMEQAKPLGTGQYPDVEPDLDRKQFRALVAFVDTLPRPEETEMTAEAERGRAVFSQVGCALCHVPDLGGVNGVYSDFLLHRLDDRSLGGSGYRPNETPEMPLPIDHPEPEEWKTPMLWGVADSAPYFHDGGAATLESAIERHHGHAEPVRQALKSRPYEDSKALVAFLKTLRAPASANPAPKAGAMTASVELER